MPSEQPVDLFWLGALTLVVAALTSNFLTPVVIRLAHALGALDHPSPRKMHTSPVPRIGGVAVFAGFIAGLAFAAYGTGIVLSFPTVTVYWGVLAVSALVLFLLGFVDDIRGVSFQWKFAVQVVAAAAAWWGGFRIEILSSPSSGNPIDLGAWSFVVTVVWIVGVTNALNLIDGLDGLAAGTALITTVAVAVIAVFREQTGVLAASLALVGSLAGFLRYNFNPARIFLGDSGSMFLGFVLAVISIRGSQKGTTAVAVLAPLLVLGLPLLDTALAIARRAWTLGRDGAREGGGVAYVVRNSRRLFLPDRGHLHHRLVAAGLSHRSTVLVLYAVVGILALAALLAVVANSLLLAALLVCVLGTSMLAFLMAVQFVARRRPTHPPQGAAPVSPPPAAGHS